LGQARLMAGNYFADVVKFYFHTPPHTFEKFWSKVNKDGPIPDHKPELGPCWVWTGSILPQGYGVFRFHTEIYTSRQLLTHRMAYELLKGPIPDEKSLDHLCRNRPCCNPSHLEPVTTGENVRRGRSFTGVNLQKTHCPRGHILGGDNLSKTKMKIGKRSCLICERELKRERRKNARDGENRKSDSRSEGV
jgi:hypothetical protein